MKDNVEAGDGRPRPTAKGGRGCFQETKLKKSHKKP